MGLLQLIDDTFGITSSIRMFNYSSKKSQEAEVRRLEECSRFQPICEKEEKPLVDWLGHYFMRDAVLAEMHKEEDARFLEFLADPEKKIRQTAYELWEKDGRPEGDNSVNYWDRAKNALYPSDSRTDSNTV